MLFNSNDFLIFFVLFCAGYFLVRNHLSLRNGLVVVCSYVFYGWWDYRFTSLLLFTSTLDFALAWLIDRTDEVPRR
jgi:D-alanyl-lipoteichoic acid acyltransferase DltB (MBOAT superfamily)